MTGDIIRLPSWDMRLSHHARTRIEELRISRDQVRETLDNPRVTWPGRNSAVEFVGDRVIVTADITSRTVITVKLRTDNWYIHGIHHLDNLPVVDSTAAA